MGATLYGMERDVRAITDGQRPATSIANALIDRWHRTLYDPPTQKTTRAT